MPDDLQLDVCSDGVLKLADQVVRAEPGQEASVQLDLELRRDDVDLLSGPDDRRRERVAEERLGRSRGASEQRQGAVGQARTQQRPHHGSMRLGQLGGDPFEHLAGDGRHVHRQAFALEIAEEAGEPRHRPAAVDHRAVPAAAADRRLQPADLLLRDLDRIEAPPAEVQREAAELAQRVGDSLEQVGVLLDEEPSAEVAACLLVSKDG
jgi:hypothetical protein